MSDSQNDEGDVFNQKLLLQEDKYVDYKPLKIFCGTYNVSKKQVSSFLKFNFNETFKREKVAAQNPDENLAPWLKFNNEDQIDIYALGFQEIVDLNTTSLLFQQNWEEKEVLWINYVNEILLNARNFKSSRKYRQVQRVRMFGLLLLVRNFHFAFFKIVIIRSQKSRG